MSTWAQPGPPPAAWQGPKIKEVQTAANPLISGRCVFRRAEPALPPLAKSKELAALAKRPCGRGDVVNLTSSLPGVATGADAAGIGRFVWLVKGQYTTDGARWQFNGTASSKEDFYNFDKKQWGERAFWAEVSTRIGSAFKGTDFKVSIDGSLPISITGTCTLNSAGQALV